MCGLHESLSKDLGWGMLPNSRPRTAIKTCQFLLSVWIAARAPMTRFLQNAPSFPRTRESRESDSLPSYRKIDPDAPNP